MKIHLVMDGKKIAIPVPPEGRDYVSKPGLNCPHCNAPLRASGVAGTRTVGYSTVTETAACRECNAAVGEIVLTFSTLFGIEEDARVMRMGVKI